MLLLAGAPAALAAGAERPYAHGVVVSASVYASEAGIEILRAGGNAIDAAVATAFTLAVTYPEAGNLGGGGFAVIHRADGNDIVFDFREQAPIRAFRSMFLDSTGAASPELSLSTHRAAGVPASVDGLLRMWQQQGSGKISRDALLAPAIRLARDGFALPRVVADDLNLHRTKLAANSAARRIFVRPDSVVWREGDLLVQVDLAATLEAIAEEGRGGFYLGTTGELIAAEMRLGGGMISLDDLDEYRAVMRPPLRAGFHGYELVTVPPPSSGGVLVLQMLALLDRFPLEKMAADPIEWPHLFCEVARRAYADRSRHLGDPDFWQVPLEGLLAPAYIEARAAGISLEHATPSAAVAPGEPAVAESDQTTHLSVMDAEGNAVALTTTLNDSFGSGIVVEGAGFLLNNEMDDFSAKPGAPNLYGLTGGEANAIEPKKRMLSSMTPMIVLKDGKALLALGSPGGSRIPTSVLQVLVGRLVRGRSLEAAVNAPRIHAQWIPDLLFYEEGTLPDSVRSALSAMGHEVTAYEGGWIGRVNAAEATATGFLGAPDPRGENVARGY